MASTSNCQAPLAYLRGKYRTTPALARTLLGLCSSAPERRKPIARPSRVLLIKVGTGRGRARGATDSRAVGKQVGRGGIERGPPLAGPRREVVDGGRQWLRRLERDVVPAGVVAIGRGNRQGQGVARAAQRGAKINHLA